MKSYHAGPPTARLSPLHELKRQLEAARYARGCAERLQRKRFDPRLSLALDSMVVAEADLERWIHERTPEAA